MTFLKPFYWRLPRRAKIGIRFSLSLRKDIALPTKNEFSLAPFQFVFSSLETSSIIYPESSLSFILGFRFNFIWMCSRWPRNAIIKGSRKLNFECLQQYWRYEQTNFVCCHFQRDWPDLLFALLTNSLRYPASSRRPVKDVRCKFSLQNIFFDSTQYTIKSLWNELVALIVHNLRWSKRKEKFRCAMV